MNSDAATIRRESNHTGPGNRSTVKTIANILHCLILATQKPDGYTNRKHINRISRDRNWTR